MEISVQQLSDLSIITIIGDVDLDSSPRVREYFLDLLAQKNSLHVDCSQISAIDSSGIATLIEAFQNTQRQKLDFKLISVPDNVMRVLQLARLDSVFPIER